MQEIYVGPFVHIHVLLNSLNSHGDGSSYQLLCRPTDHLPPAMNFICRTKNGGEISYNSLLIFFYFFIFLLKRSLYNSSIALIMISDKSLIKQL